MLSQLSHKIFYSYKVIKTHISALLYLKQYWPLRAARAEIIAMLGNWCIGYKCRLKYVNNILNVEATFATCMISPRKMKGGRPEEIRAEL